MKGFDRTVKPWVLPDITNRVKEGSIRSCWRSRVVAITPEAVEVSRSRAAPRDRLPADAVLAMTGYHANTDLLARLGIPVDPATGIAPHDERTMMTPVRGVLSGGSDREREGR